MPKKQKSHIGLASGKQSSVNSFDKKEKCPDNFDSDFNSVDKGILSQKTMNKTFQELSPKEKQTWQNSICQEIMEASTMQNETPRLIKIGDVQTSQSVHRRQQVITEPLMRYNPTPQDIATKAHSSVARKNFQVSRAYGYSMKICPTSESEIRKHVSYSSNNPRPHPRNNIELPAISGIKDLKDFQSFALPQVIKQSLITVKSDAIVTPNSAQEIIATQNSSKRVLSRTRFTILEPLPARTLIQDAVVDYTTTTPKPISPITKTHNTLTTAPPDESLQSLLKPTSVEARNKNPQPQRQDPADRQLTTIQDDDKSPMRQTLRQFNAQQPDQQQGVPAIFCQSGTVEPFMRRAVKRLGWQEVPQNANLFHIRFNISDLEGSMNDLKSCHFYNHHPANRELTTKAGLCKNLWQGCFGEHEHRISAIFPRCYDLSDLKQASDFVNDFNQTAVLSIVKIFANHYLETNDVIKPLVELYKKAGQFQCPKVFKKKFKTHCNRIDLDSKKMDLLGCDQLRLAYWYAKTYLEQHQFQEKVKQSGVKITNDLIQKLIQFHKQLVEKGVPKFGISTYEQFQLVKVFFKLKQILPQFQIDGSHNLWIVKPSYTSCGFGIYCSRTLSTILPDIKRVQQKVVMKYIENPLLINSPQLPSRKFDFRQWVLVLSWEPLDICVFDSCYLKICGQDFDLKQFEDTLRHLSNYSLNKGSGKDLVMCTSEFEQYMSASLKSTFTWQNNMLPKINDVVWRSLKALQDTQEQRQNSFEIYGFDIVLDSELNPWVIEINLSPACSERADFLTKMLDDSAIDLLGYLQNKILVQMGVEHWSVEMRDKLKQARLSADQSRAKNLNSDAFYEEHKVQNRWTRLPQSVEEIRLYNNMRESILFVQQAPSKFELLPQVVRVDAKTEKRIDRTYAMLESGALIHRVWLGYKSRKIARQIRRHNASIIVQKQLRGRLSRMLARSTRQGNASLAIQAKLRGYLTAKVAKRMKIKKLDTERYEATVKLQCLFRCRAARDKFLLLRMHRAAAVIQKTMLGYKQRKVALSMRKYLCSVKLVQRLLRQRQIMRKENAIRLQKHLNRYLQRKRILKLIQFQRAAAIAQHSLRKRRLRHCFMMMRRNASIVLIQRTARRYIIRKEVKHLQRIQALKKMKQLFRKLILKRLKSTARHFKKSLVQKVVLIQKILRGRGGAIALKRMRRQADDFVIRQEEMRVQLFIKQEETRLQLQEIQRRDFAATKIQSQIRSFLAKKILYQLMIQDGAAVMIQSCWRSYIVRKRFKKQIQLDLPQPQQQLGPQTSKKFINTHEYKRYIKLIRDAAAQDKKILAASGSKKIKSQKSQRMTKMESKMWATFHKNIKLIRGSLLHPLQNHENSSRYSKEGITKKRTLVDDDTKPQTAFNQRKPSNLPASLAGIRPSKFVVPEPIGLLEEVKKSFAQGLIERLESQRTLKQTKPQEKQSKVEIPKYKLPYNQQKPLKGYNDLIYPPQQQEQIKQRYQKASQQVKQSADQVLKSMQKSNQRNVQAVVSSSDKH